VPRLGRYTIRTKKRPLINYNSIHTSNDEGYIEKDSTVEKLQRFKKILQLSQNVRIIKWKTC
jgi:hypothetical protein